MQIVKITIWSRIMKQTEKKTLRTTNRLNKDKTVILENNDEIASFFTNKITSQNACTLKFSDRQRVVIQNRKNDTNVLINGTPLQNSAEINDRDIIDLRNSNLEITSIEHNNKPVSSHPAINLHSNNKKRFNNLKIHFSHKFDLTDGPIANPAIHNYSSEELAIKINSFCSLLNKLNFNRNKPKTLDNILETLLKLAPLNKISIIISRKKNSILDPIGTIFNNSEQESEVFTVNADIIKYVLKTSESMIIANSPPLSLNDYDTAKKSSNIICVPLTGYQKQPLGVIYAESTKQYSSETDIDSLAILSLAGQQIGIAIEKNKQDQGLKKMFLGSMLALTASIEAKDKYTKGHSERVTCYALMIADELHLPESERIIVEIAGMLHDIGKIGVPEAVLCSPEKLTPDEYEYMKQHPQIGADIVTKMPDLKGIASVSKVASAIKHHHEKYDGSGYPSGIAGK